MPRLRRLSAAAVALVLVLAAAAVAARPHLGGRAPAKRADRFTVSGSIGGLYPGARRTLLLTVRNPLAYPLTVRSIGVRIRGTRACPAGNLEVRPYRGRLLVRAHARRRVGVRATMRAGAPAACQGARFRLTFRARAVRP